MDLARIAILLQPFLVAPADATVPGTYQPESAAATRRAPRTTEEFAVLSSPQLKQVSDYLDLLLRWNARMNLTAVREPEHIVTRHFGESLFAARHLFPAQNARGAETGLIDVGSGAGFPGLPIKIWAPQLLVTLIESNRKKATFLREVIRRLALKDIEIFSGRAEEFRQQAGLVTLRAVERFETVLPVAAHLLAADGKLALLISESQVAPARKLVPDLDWQAPRPVPFSSRRVLLLGDRSSPRRI